MFYSALEQHCDGSLWYHGNTFDSCEEAEKFICGWIPWDANRYKMIFTHEKPLPDETCCTKDGGETFEFGGLVLWDKENGTLNK